MIFKLVSNTPYCGYIPFGRLGKLFAKSLDMNIYGAGISDVIVAPDMIQKLFAGKYLVW